MRGGDGWSRWGPVLALAFVFLLESLVPHPVDAAQLWYKREDLSEEEAAEVWLEQIVPYIITDEEKQTFEGLSTSEQKAAFIEQFWRRRDPDPQTPENEFLQEHIKRIVQANRLFGSGRPGWRTDRGRIFILMGPPDTVETDPMGYLPHQHPSEIWIYLNPPHPRLPSRLIFAFVDDNFDGGYDLTFDLLRDSDTTRRTEALIGDSTNFLNPQVQAEIMAMNLGRSGIYRSTFMNPNPQLEGMQNLSVVEQLPELNLQPVVPEVEAGVTFTEIFTGAPRAELRHEVGRFRTAEGSAYVPVTLDLRYGDFSTRAAGEVFEGGFSVMARLVDPEGNTQDAFVRDEHFQIPAEGREAMADSSLLYEFTLYADPGDYRLEVVVRDNLTNESMSFEEPVSVPAYHDGLRMSSVVTAEEILSDRGSARNPTRDPFTYGRFRVMPKLDRIYAADDTLDLFFEVYNLSRGADEQNNVRVEYSFRRDGRSYRETTTFPHPAPLDQMSVASSIPLKGFEPGDYTVTITVIDEVAGTKASTELSFEIR